MLGSIKFWRLFSLPVLRIGCLRLVIGPRIVAGCLPQGLGLMVFGRLLMGHG